MNILKEKNTINVYEYIQQHTFNTIRIIEHTNRKLLGDGFSVGKGENSQQNGNME
jgi:hypothetical protein